MQVQISFTLPASVNESACLLATLHLNAMNQIISNEVDMHTSFTVLSSEIRRTVAVVPLGPNIHIVACAIILAWVRLAGVHFYQMKLSVNSCTY